MSKENQKNTDKLPVQINLKILLEGVLYLDVTNSISTFSGALIRYYDLL